MRSGKKMSWRAALALLLAALMCLGACGKKENTTEAETDTAPVTTEAETAAPETSGEMDKSGK